MAIPPEKFLFDRDFEIETPDEEIDENVEEVEEIDPLLYTEGDMTAAVMQARGEGHAAGLEEARGEIAIHAAQLLEVLSERLAAIQQAGIVTREEAHHDAVEFAYLVARKLAHTVIEQVPQADVQQMVASCLSELASRTEPPKVRISVSEQLIDHITEHMAQLATNSGFGGEIVVVADAAMDPSDCRVQWDEAGAERRGADIEQSVDDAVQRFLQSQQSAIDPLRNPAAAIEQAADAAEFDDQDPGVEEPAATPTGADRVTNAAGETPDSPETDPAIVESDGAQRSDPLDDAIDRPDEKLEDVGVATDATDIPPDEQ